MVAVVEAEMLISTRTVYVLKSPYIYIIANVRESRQHAICWACWTCYEDDSDCQTMTRLPAAAACRQHVANKSCFSRVVQEFSSELHNKLTNWQHHYHSRPSTVMLLSNFLVKHN